MPPFSRRGLGLEIGYCKLLLQILVGEHVGTSDTWRVPYVTCQFEDCGKKDGLSRCGKVCSSLLKILLFPLSLSHFSRGKIGYLYFTLPLVSERQVLLT